MAYILLVATALNAAERQWEAAARLHESVETLKVGLMSALAIVEPRRRGKTTFLLEDLAPAGGVAGVLRQLGRARARNSPAKPG